MHTSVIRVITSDRDKEMINGSDLESLTAMSHARPQNFVWR